VSKIGGFFALPQLFVPFLAVGKSVDLDYIIVGQGLAGSALAMRALAARRRIMVIDQPSQNCSSAVAAGLFNPITGRKMARTWLADQLFGALHEFYSEVERLTGATFFHPMPIYRPFLNVEEQNEWMGKSSDSSFDPFLVSVTASSAFGYGVEDPYGGITLKRSGFLDTRSYLKAVREYLRTYQAIQTDTFHPEGLQLDEDGVAYQGINAKKIIFCQGVANNSNPWFKDVPINSLKGEFLTIQCQWQNDVILNRGIYMVPGSDSHQWRVGATYNWNDHSPRPTDAARMELIQKLEGIFRIPYSITDQQWGLRPTTPDRKPILGAHPDYPSLIIFNGLGTKGVSLAPYFSEVLFRWMENQGAIGKEADVSRFY
jgi:glycine/D-amino acid oxidase-like deaminating enzyme